MPADALGDVAGSIARLNRLNDGRQAMREAGDWFVRNRERLEKLSAAERQAWLALLGECVCARSRNSGAPISVAEIGALTNAFFYGHERGVRPGEAGYLRLPAVTI